jgi:hypothetical protein
MTVLVNQARFRINDTPPEDPTTYNRGYTGEHDEAISIALDVSPSPALSVRYEVYSPTDAGSPMASKNAPQLTFAESSDYFVELLNPNETVTLTLPSSGVHSWLVRCTARTPDGPHVFERQIGVLSATYPPLQKTVPAETLEWQVRGFSDTENDIVDVIAGLSTGGLQWVAREGGTHWTSYAFFYEGDGITLTDGDHGIRITNAGVLSLNEMTGDIDVVNGAGIAVSVGSQEVQVSNAGVLSVAKNGEAGITGAVTVSSGANIAITQAGSNIQIAATGVGVSGLTPDLVLFGASSGGIEQDAGFSYDASLDTLSVPYGFEVSNSDIGDVLMEINAIGPTGLVQVTNSTSGDAKLLFNDDMTDGIINPHFADSTDESTTFVSNFGSGCSIFDALDQVRAGVSGLTENLALFGAEDGTIDQHSGIQYTTALNGHDGLQVEDGLFLKYGTNEGKVFLDGAQLKIEAFTNGDPTPAGQIRFSDHYLDLLGSGMEARFADEWAEVDDTLTNFGNHSIWWMLNHLYDSMDATLEAGAVGYGDDVDLLTGDVSKFEFDDLQNIMTVHDPSDVGEAKIAWNRMSLGRDVSFSGLPFTSANAVYAGCDNAGGLTVDSNSLSSLIMGFGSVEARYSTVAGTVQQIGIGAGGHLNTGVIYSTLATTNSIIDGDIISANGNVLDIDADCVIANGSTHVVRHPHTMVRGMCTSTILPGASHVAMDRYNSVNGNCMLINDAVFVGQEQVNTTAILHTEFAGTGDSFTIPENTFVAMTVEVMSAVAGELSLAAGWARTSRRFDLWRTGDVHGCDTAGITEQINGRAISPNIEISILASGSGGDGTFYLRILTSDPGETYSLVHVASVRAIVAPSSYLASC